MARPRKSRLVPSLTTFAEELVRAITEHVDRGLAETEGRLAREVAQLRREVARLRARGQAGATGAGGRPKSARLCSVRGCAQPHVARGLCKNHYQQLRYAERKESAERSS
ncbi:MAG TPA: hypothetical protein VII38_22920 [Polyangia bacterium]|jgi:hypothetical protein